MATDSFIRDFTISKRETIERLEKSICHIKPLNIDFQNVIDDIDLCIGLCSHKQLNMVRYI